MTGFRGKEAAFTHAHAGFAPMDVVPCGNNGKGDHDVWYSPITKRHVTVDGKIKSRFTANAILKQAGIRERF